MVTSQIPATLIPSGLRRVRLYPLPEVVERDAVEEGRRLHYLAVLQTKEPGIGVGIGPAVASRAAGVEEDDDGVALGVDVADDRLQAPAHPGVERADDLAQKGLLARIGFGCRGMAD